MDLSTEGWQGIQAALQKLRKDARLVAYHPLLDILDGWAGAESHPHSIAHFDMALALLHRACQRQPPLLPGQAFERDTWLPLLSKRPTGAQLQPHQVQAFLDDLRVQARPTLFTIDPFPEGFVQRPTEYEALFDHLTGAGHGQLVAITAALRGAGGYGKTTLALALCHDPRLWQAFPDGILWVTLGETPGNLLVLQRRSDARLSPQDKNEGSHEATEPSDPDDTDS